MAEVASAFVSLMPSARGFGSKLDSQISPEVAAAGKKSGLSFGKLFAAGAALGIGSKAFSFLGDSLAEARDAQVIGARTENVIAKMGNAANISAGQVGELAAAISNKTGIDDEAIQSGQNLLLTFGNVRNEVGAGNDIFNQASQLMVDMSAAMGTDAKGSAIQLGKALNDPIKGLTALSRVGVSFTAQQQDQIKTLTASGNTLAAQKIILGELERQFGGAAESMATPADKARVSIGNLKEQIGGALLPAVDSATTKFSNFVTEMQTGEGAGGKVASAFKTVANNMDTIVPAVGAVTAGLVTYKVATLAAAAASAIQAAGTTAATGATWSLNAALRANPIGIVVTLLTALGVGLIAAYKKSDTFRAIVDKTFTAIGVAGRLMWEGAIKPAFEAMKKGFDAVGKAGTWLWNNALQPAFKFIVTGVAAVMDIWSKMLAALGKVPGFEWANKASEAMGKAAQKAFDMAAGIEKIPSSKQVNVTVAYRYTGLKSPTRGRSDDFTGGALPFAAEATGGAFMDALSRGMAKGGKKTRAQLSKMVETIKADLQTAVADFKSLSDSVANAFNPDNFGAESLTDFMAGLAGNNANLNAMFAAFDQLKAAGASSGFLSSLFQSGNTVLAQQLAAAGPAAVQQASTLFEQNASLAAQLGSKVATNELGPDIAAMRADISKLSAQIARMPKETGDAVRRGAEEGTRAGNDDRSKGTRQRERAGR